MGRNASRCTSQCRFGSLSSCASRGIAKYLTTVVCGPSASELRVRTTIAPPSERFGHPYSNANELFIQPAGPRNDGVSGLAHAGINGAASLVGQGPCPYPPCQSSSI